MSKSAFEKWYDKAIRRLLGEDYLSSQYKDAWLAALRWVIGLFARMGLSGAIQEIKAEIKKCEAEND